MTTNIEEIRARRAAISEPPWFVVMQTNFGGDYTAYVCREYLGSKDVIAGCVGDRFTPAKEDAEFIAHAPSDIDTLLDIITQLRSDCAAAESRYDALVQSINEADFDAGRG